MLQTHYFIKNIMFIHVTDVRFVLPPFTNDHTFYKYLQKENYLYKIHLFINLYSVHGYNCLLLYEHFVQLGRSRIRTVKLTN